MNVTEQLRLVKPAVEYREAYTEMVRELLETDEAWFNNFPLALEDFPAFVRELEEEAQGVNLPPGVVPQQTYWLLRENEDGVTILGEIRLRPTLAEAFEEHHGHIGYNIRPSQRGKGYATRQLALVLQEARRSGLARVMLTVEGDNPASVRVIEKNGGKLDYQHLLPASGELLSCYWIEL
ncbi:MAG TPA: GNAT family N-acetyltransferase [Ktedonobacteraceae bacterium]|nr:GNAT family N-acetyltransferase [Ktedonobacteraceae bacterium]